MKTTSQFNRILRVGAMTLLLGGVAIWGTAGARLGWTQTSAVTTLRDEITGIDYPVRRAAFIPGVEIPFLAAAIAAVLAAASFLPRRALQRA